LETLKFILVIFLFLSIYSCSTTTKIKYLDPAQIGEMSRLKRISVEEFKNDTLGLASKIEEKIDQKKINGKAYFTLLNRDNIDEIIAEQRRQYSGITTDENPVELGQLIASQAFITGRIYSKTYSDKNSYQTRQKCLDKKCNHIRKYRVKCIRRSVQLGANIKIIKIETSKIIFTHNYEKNNSWLTCRDQYYDSISEPEEVWARQTNQIANEFIREITPTFSYREIKLLDNPKINYSNKEEKLLVKGLDFIKKEKIEKADKVLSKLVFETKSQCFVALYNLGVVKESQAEYVKAKQLYILTNALLKSSNDTVNEALERINIVIYNNDKAQKQLRNN